MNSATSRFAASNPRTIKSRSDDTLFGSAALAAPNHARLTPQSALSLLQAAFTLSRTPKDIGASCYSRVRASIGRHLVIQESGLVLAGTLLVV